MSYRRNKLYDEIGEQDEFKDVSDKVVALDEALGK